MSDALWSAREDAWLSECFGGRVLRLAADSRQGRPVRECLAANPCRFAYAKVAAGAAASADQLAAAGFVHIDGEIRMRRPAGTPKKALADLAGLRPARPSDAAAVEALAAGAFVRSRYFTDPAIPAQIAQRIKREWAGNFFKGTRGEAMWIAEDRGEVVGFSLLIRTEGGLAVDLIAVAEPFRGRGWARALLEASAHTAGNSDLVAGTQLSNASSLSLYRSSGFVFDDAHGVWHYHAPARQRSV